jgi:Thrombospondin type 3 repeat
MIKKIFSTIAIFIILFSGVSCSANISINFDSSRYYKYGDVSLPNKIELPTVFRLGKESVTGNNKDGLVVVDQNNQPAQMFTRFMDVSPQSANLRLKAISPTKQFDGFMNDGLSNTFTEFDLDSDNGKASFEIDFGEKKYLEGLQISLSNNIINPEFIEILGQNLNDQFTIVAKSSYNSFLSYFPPVKASKITVNLFHSQVLRINEVYPEFGWGVSKEQAQNEWFFLAIPGNAYKAFVLQGDRFPEGWKTLDLNLGYEITAARVGELKSNPIFINKDTDSDGITDLKDNCPFIGNQDQIDKDKNSIGDACEDRDLDRIVDAKDNCSNISNYDQNDKDKDGQGDACNSFDNRFLETNTWIVPAVITICSILVIAVFATRLKKIGN